MSLNIFASSASFLFPILLSNFQGDVPAITRLLFNITAFYTYFLHFFVFDYSFTKNDFLLILNYLLNLSVYRVTAKNWG